MEPIRTFINGTPCTTNNKGTRDAWKAKIVQATAGFSPIDSACTVRVEFHLASESYITGGQFGSDLDNLLKPFLDALCETVFAPVGDECVVDLHATKRPAAGDDTAGARLEIVKIGSAAGAT